ncbi:MAG: N-6 DNA methylase, partial [Oscillospiraceae bacterium]|nr:N-6 DNA methylase [Oscillospiraceae bacterium]
MSGNLVKIKQLGDEPASEFKRLLREIGGKHSAWKAFEDFLALAAISLSNSVDRTHYDEREAEYLRIIGRYDKTEADKLAEMLGCLVLDAERQNGSPEDTLGRVFHEMDFNSKWTGQYFSPQYICNMMAKMAFGDPKETIERRGYICVEEPCCGSGAMLLGMAGTMLELGYNYQQQCLVHATDIDLKCIHMCYIQLALRGIPAIIVHGNALSREEYSRWYTPQFLLGGWAERLNLERTRGSIMEII